MRKAALHNLGCKVNSYETEAMQQLLEAAGYEIVDFEDQADVYIINTCSVTNMADKKSRQMLHRAKAKNPDAVVVAAGCYVQAAGEKLKEDDAIDLVVGHEFVHCIKVADVGLYEGVVFFVFNVLEVGQVSCIGQLVQVDDIIFRVLVYK